MRAIKKVLALCLSAILLLALCPAAFADTTSTTNATVTIADAKKGESYKIYRMFDVLSVDTSVNPAKISYKVTDAWARFFTEGAAGAEYITLTDGYPTWNEGKSAADFAKAAKEYVASATTITATKTATATAGGVTFTLPLGYYFVDSSLGAVCNLTSAHQDVTIHEKNGVPTVDKKVKEGGNYGPSNTAKIGDMVEFQSVITLEKGTENLVYHDRMGSGLTLNAASVSVACSDTNKPCKDKYRVTTTGLTDGCTFEIAFTDNTYITSLAENTTLTVTYSAVLNEKVDVVQGEDNTAWLKYGDASKTEDQKTNTKTLQFDLVKWYAGANNTKPLLAGAKFRLYSDAQATTEIPVVRVTGKDNTYRVAKTDETSEEIITVDSGAITIYGLDNETYYLKETEAPAGFNKLTNLVEVNLTGGNNLTATEVGGKMDGNATGAVSVENKAGTTLPSTGGMGTTLFYVVGGLLMAAAAVLLIAKKRMGKNA